MPSSFPFLDSSGSVQEDRSKQQGRRLPDSSFEIATSTRRARVSAFFVALIQRTHSQRAIGVRLCHTFSRSPASARAARDRKSTRLNSSHVAISYAVFCLKKKNKTH